MDTELQQESLLQKDVHAMIRGQIFITEKFLLSAIHAEHADT